MKKYGEDGEYIVTTSTELCQGVKADEFEECVYYTIFQKAREIGQPGLPEVERFYH